MLLLIFLSFKFRGVKTYYLIFLKKIFKIKDSAKQKMMNKPPKYRQLKSEGIAVLQAQFEKVLYIIL